MKKRNYKYKIGQTIINPQVGAVKVTYRWKAKRYNFYDVLILKDNSPWTFDEVEIIEGYNSGMTQSFYKQILDYMAESMVTQPIEEAVLSYLKGINAFSDKDEIKVKKLIKKSLYEVKCYLEEME